jgi:hypothetical protein
MITSLSNVIQQGNVGGQIDVLNQLNGKMNTQMTWLKSRIRGLQSEFDSTRVKADSESMAAYAARAKADSDLMKAVKETGSAMATDAAKAEDQVRRAKADQARAASDMDHARQEKVVIDQEANKLDIEQKRFSDIQPLKADIIHQPKEKKDQIVADLKLFASTLP